MNDESQNTQGQSEIPDIEELNRQYFEPDQQEEASKAVQRAQEIASAHGLPVAFNWDAENQSLPDGYGVAIIPVQERREGQGIAKIGVYIAGVPSIETVLQHEKGNDWLRTVGINHMLNKFSNAVRPRGGQPSGMAVPFSVEDFITSASRDQGLQFFREISASWVKALKKLGLRVMNVTLLRQVLASRSFAEQQFPNVSQEKWEKILDKMLEEAEQKKADAGIIKVWRETRNDTELSTGDFDLEELDQLI